MHISVFIFNGANSKKVKHGDAKWVDLKIKKKYYTKFLEHTTWTIE